MPSDILIQPNRGSTTLNPIIFFSGSAANNSIRLETLPSGSVAFLGKSGSLFSIVDSMSGSLMAVSDVSGLPILEVFSDDRVVMGKFNKPGLIVSQSQVRMGYTGSVANFTGYALAIGPSYGKTGYIGISGTGETGIEFGAREYTNYGSWAKLYSDQNGYTGLVVNPGSSIGGGTRASNYPFLYYADSTPSNDRLDFQSGGSNAMTINGSQNVGIGKTAPINAKLDVNGNATVTGSLTVVKSGGTSANTAIRATAGNNAGYFGSNQLVMSWDGGLSYSHAIKTRHDSGILGNNAIDFYLWKAGTDAAATIGTQQVMSLFDNATVSINKTSANATLDVTGSVVVTGSFTVVANVPAIISGSATVALIVGTTASYGSSGGQISGPPSLLVGRKSGSGVATCVELRNESINSGTGCALDFMMTTAYSAGGIPNARIQSVRGSSFDGTFEIYCGGQIDWPAILITDASSGTSAGNVAIGKQANTQKAIAKLDVNGGTVISGSLTVGTGIAQGTTGEIRATNNITAYYSSDERLKTNIVKIDNPLEKLAMIDGVLYDWNDTYKKQYGQEDGYFIRKQNSGVIAQQVEKVFPNVVADRQDGYKAVRYELLVPLLIEGIKEQQTQIKDLQDEILKLKNKIK